jgi:hypothetical protein
MTAGEDVDQDQDEDEERERRRRRRKKREPEPEPTPVISGRLLIAAAIILVLTLVPRSNLGALFEPKDPTIPKPNTWKVGGKATIALTLITADYNKLACASESVFDGYRCAFKSENEAFPREPGAPIDDNKGKIIQPYRTWLDNQLVLVAGLWAQPALALRLHREPPQGIDEDKLARFVTECEVTFIGVLAQGSKLQWNRGQWVAPDMNAIVARPDSCKIVQAEPP